MIEGIDRITSEIVTVIDPEGRPKSIFIELTPKRKYLTQTTQKRLLSTGFMKHVDASAVTDRQLIKSVMHYIRSAVLAALGEVAQ